MIKKNYLFKKENNIKLKELKKKRKIKSIVKQTNKQNENQLNPLSSLEKYLLSQNENKDEITALNFEDDNIFDDDFQDKILNDQEKQKRFHKKLKLDKKDEIYINNNKNFLKKDYNENVKKIYKKYIDRIRNDNEIYTQLNTDKLPYESDINYYNRISKLRYYAPTAQDLIFDTKQKYKKTFKDYLMKLTNNDNLTSDKIMNNIFFKNDNNLIYIVDRLKDFDRKIKKKYNNITIKGFLDFSNYFIEEQTNKLLTYNNINELNNLEDINQDPTDFGEEEIDVSKEEIVEDIRKLIILNIKKHNRKDTNKEDSYKWFFNKVKKEENRIKLQNIFYNINNGKIKSVIQDKYIDDIYELVK